MAAGIDLNMDHHREGELLQPFQQSRLRRRHRGHFNSGGSGNRGAHSGAYNTYC